VEALGRPLALGNVAAEPIVPDWMKPALPEA
jgi:hypothetical protein